MSKTDTVSRIDHRISEVERQLEESNRMVENSPDIMVRFDRKKRCTFFNKSLDYHTGLPREKILGRTPEEIKMPPQVGAALDMGLEIGKEATIEHKIGDRDYQTRVIPEKDDGGSVISAIIICRDITGRKNVERALQRSEETFRTLAQNLPDIIARFDCDFRFLYVNPAGERMLGRKRDEIIGKTVRDFGMPDKATSFVSKTFGKVCKTKKGMAVEALMPFPDGERCVSSHIAPELDGEGNVVSLISITRDVTQLKAAERAVQESEEKYRTLVERAGDGIIIVQDGILVFANQRMADLDGSTIRELIGSSFLDHVYGDEVPRLKELYMRRIAGEEAVAPYETVLKRKNGGPVPAEINAAVITYCGQPADLIVIRDISSRKKAEEALRESEARFRTLVEASPYAITYTDAEGTILYANRRAAEMHGNTDVNGIKGKSAFSLIDPADRPRAGRNMKMAIKTGVAENVEYALLREDGSKFPAELSAKAVLNEKDQLKGFIGITQDITERKKIENKVARREKEFRALAENSPEFIFRFDRDCRIMYVNPKGAALISRPGENVIGKRPADFSKHGGEAGFWDARLREVFSSGQERTIDFVDEHDGRKIYYKTTLVPELSDGGAISSVLSIGRDVTREKVAERQLTEALTLARKRAREAEQGQQVLTVLMDNIAEGLLITDAQGKIRFLSRYLSRVTGVSMEEALGKPVSIVDEKLYMLEGSMPPRDDDPISLALMKGEVTIAEERNIRAPDGSVMTVLINAQPIRNGVGEIIGSLASWRDITERKRTENALRRNEYELRTLVDNSPDIIIRFDRHMRYAYANPAFERITGISRDDLTGKTNEEMGMPRERRDIWEGVARAVFESGRDGTVEFDMTSFFGKRFFSGRVIPEFAKDGSVETVMIIARDITERKRYEEKIRFISFHDAVTGLYNRAYYEEELLRIDSERELPISVIMGDVNNLKLSNDVLGHHEGDLLLKTVAASIQRACRKNDIVARWGGDEFAVLLPRTEFATAETVRQRIQQIAAESTGTVVRPSIALGVATKDRRDRNINQVVRRAEEMMYVNKMSENKKNEENVIASLLSRARSGSRDFSAHVERSCDLARRFGRELGLSEEQAADLEMLIRLHDIGMAALPREILAKAGPLTEEEWELIRKHPEAGFEITRAFADTSRISDAVFAHEEHWDGSGYPRGLAKDKIPYLARVFALIEAYDVMTHQRPYGRRFTPEEAAKEIARCAGAQFDPALVDVFINVAVPAGAR